jgi:chromosome segregation protein
VVAKPPGKDLSSLTLLSGGERTMTTIALLFAIFRSRLSPFCILDEIDAPLDDSNVGRFLQLLREFTGDCRFVIITHNKQSMAGADTLYGITMQEPGVSKRISITFEEAAKHAREAPSGEAQAAGVQVVQEQVPELAGSAVQA